MSELSPYDFLEKDIVESFERELEACTTNRQALCTSELPLTSCVDWFQVTFNSVDDYTYLTDLFSLSSFDFIHIAGKNFYQNGFIFGGITFYTNGANENMGVHMLVSGKGCRFLETLEGFSWHDFFKKVDSLRDYNVTRIDVAIDDMQGYFKIPSLVRKIKQGECVSKFRKARVIETIDISTGANEGTTLYFGQPSSRLMFRIYEKNHEQAQAGLIHDHEVWNRFELQMRKERAMKMYLILLNNKNVEFTNEIKSIIKNYVRFTVKNKNDTNNRRWDTAPFWKKFIGDLEKLSLSFSFAEKTLEETIYWFKKQYGATMGMMMLVGEDPYKIGVESMNKLKKEHYSKIDYYNHILEDREKRFNLLMELLDFEIYKDLEENTFYNFTDDMIMEIKKEATKKGFIKKEKEITVNL